MRASDFMEFKDLPPYELAVWTNAVGTDMVFYKLPRKENKTPIMRVLYSTTKKRPKYDSWWGTYDESWICVPLGEYVESGE